jgi:hypothetical protein
MYKTGDNIIKKIDDGEIKYEINRIIMNAITCTTGNLRGSGMEKYSSKCANQNQDGAK